MGRPEAIPLSTGSHPSVVRRKAGTGGRHRTGSQMLRNGTHMTSRQKQSCDLNLEWIKRRLSGCTMKQLYRMKMHRVHEWTYVHNAPFT